MPYGEGQPHEETVIEYGTGNHLVMRWGNISFSFRPEGDLAISEDTGKALYIGDEIDLITILKHSQIAKFNLKLVREKAGRQLDEWDRDEARKELERG